METRQSSDLVVAFFVPEWAERRPAVLVRKAKNRLEAVGMMAALMCQTAYVNGYFWCGEKRYAAGVHGCGRSGDRGGCGVCGCVSVPDEFF